MKTDLENIIFDFDGTLVDSIQAIWQTTAFTVQHFIDQIKPIQPVDTFSNFQTAHTGSRDLFNLFQRIYGDETDIDLLKEIVAFHQSHSPNYFKSSILFSGVEDWIITLKNQDYRLFIATNNKLSNVESVFADISEDFMSQYFTGWVDYYSCSDGNGGYLLKPQPDMILKLVSDHSLDLTKTLLIGDDIKDFAIKNYLPELKIAGVAWSTLSVTEMRSLSDEQSPHYVLENKDLSSLVFISR